MLNLKGVVLLLSLCSICVMYGVAQTAPCQAGTMAGVVGSSCSVGPIIFNFQNDFSAQSQIADQSNFTQGTISPAEIGFIPIHDDNHAGFKLVTNFTDGPGSDSTFFENHLVQFSYTPQAAPGFEIRVQGLSMDAAAQGSPADSASVQVIDGQNYPNSGPLQTFTDIDIENDVTVFDQLSNNLILEVPGFFSNSTGLFGSPTTTQLNDFSTGSASAVLRSVTFLYTTGAVIPAPAPATLAYTNIDLPGAAGTTPSSITDSGRIVGTVQDASGGFHGYVEEPDGRFTTIDGPGATSTFGDGLNERGDVVGSFVDSAGQTHGFLLRGGSFTTIDFPQAISTIAIGINDRGQIVGQYELSDSEIIPVHGFVLDDGVFTTINHGSGAEVIQAIVGINNQNEITGFFFDPNTFRSFTEQFGQPGSFQTFDVPGQGNTTVDGINDAGVLVGTYDDVNLVQHGFVGLPGLFRTVDFPGGSNTFPAGINALGSIVGAYSDAAGNQHGFLATSSGDNDDNNNAISSGAGPAIPAKVTTQPQEKLICGGEEWRRKAQLRGSACWPTQ